MGIIENAAREAGMTIERDVPIPGQRRCKDWARLIGIARKLESEEDRLSTAEAREIAKLSAEKAELQRKLYEMASKVAHFELKERMQQTDLTPKDQKYLLGEPTEHADPISV